MDIRQLRYFVAAVEARSIAAAAKKIGLSQPALTRAIHDLESSIGITLLARSANGVHPTAKGNDFYEHAKLVLHQFTLLEDSVRRSPNAETTLSYTYPISSYLTSMAIVSDALKVEFPSLKINFVKKYGLENCIAFLRSKQPSVATVYLGDSPRPADVELMEFIEFHDCVAVPTSHRLSSLPEVRLAELAGERLGLAGYFQGYTSPSDRVHREYSSVGVHVFNFDKSFEIDDLLSQLALGGDLVWLPSTMVIAARNVKYLKVKDVLPSQIYLATLKNVKSEIADRFLEVCKLLSPEIQLAMDELVTAANSKQG